MSEYVERKALPAVLAGMSKKAKAAVVVEEGNTMTLCGTNWDGGSRSTYTLVNLATGQTRSTPTEVWGSGVTPEVVVPAGWVLVEGGTFCGKPSTLRVHVCVPLERGTPAGIVADWLQARRVHEERLLRMPRVAV